MSFGKIAFTWYLKFFCERIFSSKICLFDTLRRDFFPSCRKPHLKGARNFPRITVFSKIEEEKLQLATAFPCSNPLLFVACQSLNINENPVQVQRVELCERRYKISIPITPPSVILHSVSAPWFGRSNDDKQKTCVECPCVRNKQSMMYPNIFDPI